MLSICSLGFSVIGVLGPQIHMVRVVQVGWEKNMIGMLTKNTSSVFVSKGDFTNKSLSSFPSAVLNFQMCMIFLD